MATVCYGESILLPGPPRAASRAAIEKTGASQQTLNAAIDKCARDGPPTRRGRGPYDGETLARDLTAGAPESRPGWSRRGTAHDAVLPAHQEQPC